MSDTAKMRAKSMHREKVHEPTGLVIYDTYSLFETPVTTSHHEVTYDTI
jgi:hypothetical protein